MKVVFLTTDNRDAHRRYEKSTPYFGTAPEALLQGFAQITDIEIHVVSCTQRPMRSPTHLAPNIFFHSILVPKIGWMRTGYQGCIRATRRKIAEIQPDVVHGQGTERDCSLCAVFSGFPNLLTIHGNMRAVARVNHSPPFSFPWLAAKLEAFVLPRTDGVLCITDYTREAVQALARKTWVVPNAVDAGFFEVQAKNGSRTGLCVGTITGHKNQNDLIRSLDSLAASTPFKILFLGQLDKGSYGTEFSELLKSRPWCQNAGWADREKLKDYLNDAAFLILPSLEDNCPMVVLEAMAAGVPVAASAIGGVPELVKDGITGLLCDPSRPETFRGAIEKLLGDHDFAQRLSSQAKVWAREKFDPRVIAAEHLRIYRELQKLH